MRGELEGRATERVLDAAEGLFVTHGYAAVTLRLIADALSMKQASLYYHVPGGKEDLYVRVMRRMLARHRTALLAVGAASEPGEPLPQRLLRIARWVASQPPMNLGRFMDSDMPALEPRHRRQLEEEVTFALMEPIEQLFSEAAASGTVLRHPARACAGAFWSIVPGVKSVARASGLPLDVLLPMFVDLVLHGAVGREPTKK